MSTAINMIVPFVPKPEKAKRFLEVLAPVAKYASENEPGCQLYTVYTQTKGTSGTIYITERWENQAALDAHLQTSGFKTFAEALQKEDLLASPLEFDEVFMKPTLGHGA